MLFNYYEQILNLIVYITYNTNKLSSVFVPIRPIRRPYIYIGRTGRINDESGRKQLNKRNYREYSAQFVAKHLTIKKKESALSLSPSLSFGTHRRPSMDKCWRPAPAATTWPSHGLARTTGYCTWSGRCCRWSRPGSGPPGRSAGSQLFEKNKIINKILIYVPLPFVWRKKKCRIFACAYRLWRPNPGTQWRPHCWPPHSDSWPSECPAGSCRLRTAESTANRFQAIGAPDDSFLGQTQYRQNKYGLKGLEELFWIFGGFFQYSPSECWWPDYHPGPATRRTWPGCRAPSNRLGRPACWWTPIGWAAPARTSDPACRTNWPAHIHLSKKSYIFSCFFFSLYNIASYTILR